MPRERTTIVCVLVPRFALRVAAGMGGALPSEPAALGPEPGGAAVVGETNAAAAAFGVAAGMRVGEALSRCPRLRLVTADPGAVADAGEALLQRLEEMGAEVESLAPGRALFCADGLVRLHGGLARLLSAAAASIGRGGRMGAGPGRFIAQAAAVRARPGHPRLVETGAAAGFLASMPVSRLPLDAATADTLHALGIRTAGELAVLPLPSVADRFGHAGIAAWRLARGEDEAYVAPRTPPEPLRDAVEFPEPVGDEFTLRGALTVLIARLLGHPRRAGRPPRTLAVSARLAAGGSWRRPVTLREPTADPLRLRDALAPRLVELPGAVEQLSLEITALCASADRQQSLFRPPAELLRERAAEAARQVRAGLGEGHLWRVVEVAPWSRVPEGRDLLVPFDG
jgi:nucleotidyltransferase/DNA polymerase involved in DNA repair